MSESTRRAFIVAAIAGGVAIAGRSGTHAGTIVTESLATRTATLSPTPGGTAITVDGLDGYGTLAGGVLEDGESRVVTCRHVVDPEYPDGDDDEVIGRTVYKPDDSTPVGQVVAVGDSKGANSTDWALISSDDGEWTGEVLGLGAPSSSIDAGPGDRIVMSGISTGLLGGEITAVGVERNWRGTIIDGLIEYRVDDDADTAGNSGSWIGLIDDGFRPIGMHAFRVDDYRYAIPLEHIDGIEFDGTGDLPDAPDTSSRVEGAIADYGDGALEAAVANIGGESVTGRTIEVQDSDGETVDSTTVDLDPFDHSVLSFESPDDPTLSTRDVIVSAIDP